MALYALTMVCVVLAIGPWPVGVFQDDGIYMVLAKSIATGEGYRFLQMPGAPNATHYPPLYPAFLAMLWKVSPAFPQNVAVFKFANAFLLAIAAVGTFRFAREWGGLGERGAALMTVAFVSCAPLVLLSVMVLSEPFFLVFLIPTVIAAERAVQSGKPRDAMLAGAAAGILSLIRSLGLLVAPAAVLVLLYRRRWTAAFALCAALVVVVAPWQFWVMRHAHEVPNIYLGKYGSYFGWWTQAIRTEGLAWVARVAAHNLRMITEQGWATTSTETLPLALRLAATVGLGAFFVGGLARLFRRLPATALFVSLYFTMVIVWPFAPARFTWGIWPLVGLCFATGVQWVWDLSSGARALSPAESRPRVWVRPVMLSAAALLLAGYASYNAKAVTRGWWNTLQGSVAGRAQPLAEWVMANTQPTDLLATDDDILIYLYTGRHTVPTGPFTAQEHLVPQTPAFAAAGLREILQQYRPSYIMASTQYGTYATNGLVVGPKAQIRVVTVLKTGAVYAPLARPVGPP
ncbi:MAG: glycosyltransferase family 39 protein [Gemmatimonadaceae bacterium]